MWSFAKWKGKRTKLSNTNSTLLPCALLINPRTVWSGGGWMSVLFEDLENLCDFIHASVPLFLYNWLFVLHQGKKESSCGSPPPQTKQFLWIKVGIFFLSKRFVCFLLCTRTLRLYFIPTVVTFHKSNYCTSPKSLRKVSCRDLQWAPALLDFDAIKASVWNGLLYFLWGKWITTLFSEACPQGNHFFTVLCFCLF